MTNDKTKIAVVTGASRGLGKNTALALAKKGVGIIVTYNRSPDEAKNVVSTIEEMGGQAVALQLDTSDTKNFDSFAAQLKQSLQHKWQTKQLDFLANNAGIWINKPFTETTKDDFDRTFLNISIGRDIRQFIANLNRQSRTPTENFQTTPQPTTQAA
jgi:NAD(P)-dependent dehydrogenase (short-subunit alcohol dehydrogenase family)